MKRLTVADLIEAGLITPEPQSIQYEWDRETDKPTAVERFRRWSIHVTGPNHKNHRSSLIVWADTGNMSIDRPHCGSASRWGAIMNTAINARPVTCGRCGPCSDRCPVVVK